MLTPRQRIRRSPVLRATTWLMALYMVLSPILPVLAMPRGPQVVSGDVSYTRNGNAVVVYQGTDRAIVNYEGFDILSGESLQFVQPGSSAAILNRVVGGDPSEIAGALLANGRVFLINPNGILFSPSANVDVGGLVASALNMSDNDFMAGRLAFAGGGGDVVNQGSLNGGFVYLIGGAVANSGSISASDVILAAGGSVLIDRVAGGEVHLVIDGVDTDPSTLTNAAPDIATAPAAEATGAVPAPSTSTEQEQSTVLAQLTAAMASAGAPADQAGTVINQGSITVSGIQGGEVRVSGTQVGQFGTIQADGLLGDGGTVELRASDAVVLSADSVTTANAGLIGNGGTILVVGDRSATVATGARLEARGGAQSGNGGLVETSGHESFHIGATPDVSAPAGAAGTWLIDPSNITISNGLAAVQISTNSPFIAMDAESILNVIWVRAALTNGANVVITTTTTNLVDGNITWLEDADLDYDLSGTNTLTLMAANNLSIAADIVDSDTLLTTDQLGLALLADADGSGAGDVTITGRVELNGGDFTASGANFANTGNGSVQTGGGTLNVTVTNAIALGANLDAGAGVVTLIAGSGILDDGNNATTIAGGTVNLTAGASIGAAGATGQIDTDAGTLNAAATTGDVHLGELDAVTIGTVTAGGNVVVTNSAGNMTVGTVTAGGGATLSAAGSLVDDLNNATRVTGGTITLTAANGDIGAAGPTGQLDVASTTLNATARSLWIDERDATTLNFISAQTNAAITAAGDLTVVMAGAGSTLRLTTQGSILDDGDDTTSITASTLRLQAGGNIGAAGAMAQVDTDVGSIGLVAGTNIFLRDGGFEAFVTNAQAGGNIALESAGTLTTGPITAGGKASILSGGAILQTNGVINAQEVDLHSFGDVRGQVSSKDPLDISTPLVTAMVTNTAAGNILLENKRQGDSSISGIFTPNGDIVYTQAVGVLTILGPVVSSDDSNPNDNISIYAGDGIVLKADVVLGSEKARVDTGYKSGNDIVPNAFVDGIIEQHSPAAVYTYASNATAASHVVLKSSTTNQDLFISGGLTNDFIAKSAKGNIVVVNGSLHATDGDIKLSADSDGNGIGGVGISNSTLIATGDISLAGSYFSIPAFTNINASIALSSDTRLVAGGNVNLHGKTGAQSPHGVPRVFIAGKIDTATGAVSIISAGSVEIDKTGRIDPLSIIVTAGVDIVVNGYLAATNLIDLSATNSITQDPASAALLTDRLVFRAGTNVALTSTSNSFNTVSGTAGGSIALIDASPLTVVATAPHAGLTAGQNLAVTTPVLTNAAAISAGGHVTLTADAMTLTPGSSSVAGQTVALQTLTSTNDVKLGTADPAAALGLSDAELDTITAQQIAIRGSNILVAAAINPDGASALSLTAAGAITDPDNFTLTEQAIALTAGEGIQAQLATRSIDAITTNGDVTLLNSSAAATTAGALRTGSGAIALTQSGGGALTVTNATASGAITLAVVDGANLTAGTVAAGSTATLSADGSILDDGDNATRVAGTTVTLTAGNAVGATGATGQLETQADALTVTATSGSIHIGETDAATLTSLTAGGDVVVTNSSGDLTLVTVSAGGNTTLAAGGSLLDDNNDLTRITGDTVTLTAGGTIGTDAANGQLDTTADTLNATAAAGDIRIIETDAVTLGALSASSTVTVQNLAGDMTIGSVSGQAVTLTSSTGSLLDDNLNSTRVTGGTVALVAGAAIGATGPTGQIDTAADSLTAIALGGDLNVGESDAIILTGVGAIGNVVVTNSTGNMTVGTVISVGGDATLAAGGSILDDNDNATRVTGSIVSLSAGSAIGAPGADAQLDTDAGTLHASAASGGLHVGEASGLTLGTVTASGDIVVTNSAGDMTLGAVTAGGDATLTAAGSLVDDGLNSTRVTGSTVTLTAGGAVGAAGAAEQIDTAAITLFASAAAGDVHVGELNDLSLESALASGNVVVTSAADMVVGTVKAGGDVTLASTGGSIGDDNDNATRVTGGTVTLTAAGAVGSIGAVAQMDTAVDTIHASAAAGGVFIGEADGVTLGTVTAVNDDIVVTNGAADMVVGTVTATGADVLLGSGGSLVDDGANGTRVTGNAVTLNAAGAIGAAGATAQIDTAAQTLNATSGGANSIFVGEADSVALGTVTSGADVTLVAGGSILDDDDNTTGVSAANVNLTAGGAIGAAGATGQLDTDVDALVATAGAGDLHVGEADALAVTLATATGDVVITNSAGDLTIATVTAGGDATLGAAGNLIDDNDNSTRITGATVSLAAGGAVGAAGATGQMDTDAGTLNAAAAAGDVNVGESNAVTLDTVTASGNVVITNSAGNMTAGVVTAGGDVTLTAAGSILDDGDNSTTVAGSTLTLNAAGAIGATGATGQLETDATTLNVTAASGGVFLGERDGVTLNNVTATGDIVVTNSTGDMTVNTVTAGGTATLVAAGDLLDDSVNATRITGTTVTLGAGGSIGATGATAQMDTTAGTLNANGTSGNVHIGEADAVTLGTVVAGNDLVITNSAGNMTAGAVNAGGDATLVAAGSLLDDLDNGTRVGGDLLTLTAGGSIGATGASGQLETDASTLIASAPGGIFINEQNGITLKTVISAGAVVVTNSAGVMTVETVTAGTAATLGAADSLLDDGNNATRITAATVTLNAGNAVGAAGANAQIDTTAGTLNGRADAGDFHVGEQNALTIGTVTAGGDIVITNSAGNIIVGTVTAGTNSTGGDATLTAANSLLDDNDNSTRITADTGILTALLGNIGAPGPTGQIDTLTYSLQANAPGGSVYIGEADTIFLTGIAVAGTASVATVVGNITVETLSAGQQVQLSAGGSILDDGNNATRIVTPSLLLEAVGGSIGAGTVNAEIDTDVDAVSARANNGNIHIGEANALTVLAASAGGNIVITNGSADAITLQGPVVATSGSVLVHSADDIVMNNALSAVRAGGAGDVALWADGDFIQKRGAVRSGNGDVNISGQIISQNAGATVGSDSGTIFLTAYGAAPGGTLNLNGSISATAGNVVMSARSIGGVGNVQAGNTLVLNATAGSITLSGLLRARNVGLRARQSIGTSVQSLRVDADTLATSVDLGNVNISELSSVASGPVAVPVRVLSPFVPADIPGPNVALLNQQLRGGLTSANDLSFKSGGSLSGSSVRAGGDATLDIGGGYTGAALDVGGDADLTVDGDMEIDTIDVGGSFKLQGGGDFVFEDLTADDVLAEVDGDIGMGNVDTGDAEFRGGSVSDNGSLINADNLILTAGGDIGSAKDRIRVEVGLLDEISGRNVYLQHDSASPVLVNLVSGSGDVSLSAPRAVILDANDTGVGPVNFIAGDLLALEGQQIGERTNPLEINAGRFLQFVTPDDFNTDIGFVWVLTTGTISGNKFGEIPEFDAGRLPGLIIFNNQVVGGSDAVLREIFRTEAFVVETPELKSRQGIFGSPYFLHNYMNISEPVALGLIDYVLYGQAEVTADPEMPPEAKRGIVIGGGAVSSKIMPSYWQLPVTAKR
ncbi:MAG: filamentous hemagglutinin N-terminal domain-containing protein [Lentisphaerae bacterium]|nr:filamentous hemagglutinin N-terminal domain-containing protein [Lentisphaerota bacterium]